MEKHPQAELIKQVLDGLATPEQWNSAEWIPCAIEDILECPKFKYRAKPAEPEKVYPVTQMTYPELYKAWSVRDTTKDGMTDVANAALRHAVDNGYLLTPEQAKKLSNESFHFGVDNALAGMPKKDTAERDQKVAQAVYLAAQNILDARMTFAIEHARKAMLAELLESLPAIVKEVQP